MNMVRAARQLASDACLSSAHALATFARCLIDQLVFADHRCFLNVAPDVLSSESVMWLSGPGIQDVVTARAGSALFPCRRNPAR